MLRVFRKSMYFGQSSATPPQSIDAGVMTAMIISMIIASVCSVFPVSQLWASMRPLFLFVVMLFWVLHRPEFFGAWFACIIGVISDLLLDTLLGQQALSGIAAVFVIQYLTINIKRINDVFLWFFAAIAIVIFNITLLVLQYLDGQVIIWRNGLPMFTSILLWPVVAFFLKRF